MKAFVGELLSSTTLLLVGGGLSGLYLYNHLWVEWVSYPVAAVFVILTTACAMEMVFPAFGRRPLFKIACWMAFFASIITTVYIIGWQTWEGLSERSAILVVVGTALGFLVAFYNFFTRLFVDEPMTYPIIHNLER